MTSEAPHDHGTDRDHGHAHGAGHGPGPGHGDPYVWQPSERRSRVGWWLLVGGIVLVVLGVALRQWAKS